MANTFELISAVTVGSGGAASIDFTSIPATYTDLCLKLSARSTAGGAHYAQVDMTFNGLTTNRTNKMLYGTGSGVASTSGTNFTWEVDGSTATASTFANTEIYIPNYAGSSYKSFSLDTVEENNATAAYAEFMAGLWSSIAAIDRVTLTMVGGFTSFAQYSTAYLYGVKNA